MEETERNRDNVDNDDDDFDDDDDNGIQFESARSHDMVPLHRLYL